MIKNTVNENDSRQQVTSVFYLKMETQSISETSYCPIENTLLLSTNFRTTAVYCFWSYEIILPICLYIREQPKDLWPRGTGWFGFTAGIHRSTSIIHVDDATGKKTRRHNSGRIPRLEQTNVSNYALILKLFSVTPTCNISKCVKWGISSRYILLQKALLRSYGLLNNCIARQTISWE